MSELPYITQIENDGVVVLAPVGEFDISTVDLLRETFVDAVTADSSKLVIDLSGMTFLDSMALGAIIGANRRANGWNGWVRLVAPRPGVRKILHVTNLDKVFGLYDTVDQAIAHVQAPP